LLSSLREDSEAAFTQIYYQYWKLLFAVAVNKLDNTSDAEEIVQEVFADLWRRRHEIRIEQSLKAYLATAVKFQVYTLMAKKHRDATRQEGSPTPDNWALSPDEEFRQKELQEQLYQVTQELPDKCRLVYQLSREAGMSNKEIAAILDISEKTVENQMTKALKRLRTVFRIFF
jgi:RNA polymerase sigma-70 factor (ECF subfamily)